jgi:hypothetical protein
VTGNDDTRAVLCEVWRADGAEVAALDDIDAPKVCKRTAGLDFGGFADPAEVGADGDLRSAWKAKLRREGKLATGPGSVSVRELIFGTAEGER